MVTHQNRLVVFQDLLISHLAGRDEKLRRALLTRAAAPWEHAADYEEDLREFSRDSIIAFKRSAANGLDAAALVLWSTHLGYEVSNIVPLETGELGPKRYNAILQDFVERIARPAIDECGLQLELSDEYQSVEDWLSADAAEALKTFSQCANKSTGTAHSLDRSRWNRFLIEAHRSRSQLDTNLLERWLMEVEGWSDDAATKLIIEYERGRALLTAYDQG